jgi:S1-C subfamily serine protease
MHRPKNALPSRRSILFGAAAAAATTQVAIAENAPPPLTPTTPDGGAPKPRQPSIAEQLTHSTVLLRAENGKGQKSTGTGFMFSFFRDGDTGVQTIVTNKHVVVGQKKISVRWTKKTPSGEPDYGRFIDIVIEPVETRLILHPDPEVDLAIIAVSDLMTKAAADGRPIYAVGLDQGLVASEDALKDFQPIEEVLIIGYPDGLSDTKNNIPILRRGITATPAYMRFEGRRQFMIDAAIYNGSSGSPVFLYNNGAWSNREGQTQIGTRVSLLGIIWGVMTAPTEGEVRLIPAPTQYRQAIISNIPHNLVVREQASK